jgi:carboxylate-amine ligase
VESTQLWWSVRPHHAFGTVEVRICDAQTSGAEASNLAGVIVACVAQAALDFDDGVLAVPLRQREIEENLWQAIRFGLDGTQIDFVARRVVDTAAALEGILEWTEPARAALGLDLEIPAENGAQRARRRLGDVPSLADVYRETVEETAATYAAAAAG